MIGRTIRDPFAFVMLLAPWCVAIPLAFSLVATTAAARTIYQCKGPDGRITMTDQPCAGNEVQSEREIADSYRGTPIRTKRSAKVKYQFQRDNPCPRNGAVRGRCPGHDIDHIKPLCLGGLDDPINMQWLTLEAHREKTRRDVFECALAKRSLR